MTQSNSTAAAATADDALRLSLEVEIPSDIRYIERVVEIVRHQCCAMSFASQHCSLNVPVALSEAMANAILRGNRQDPAKAVTVRAQIDRAHLVLEVKDEGEGFDLDSSTVDVNDPANLEREDGRGLFLMKSLMHRVERFDDGGNVVRLTLDRGSV